MVPQLKIIVLSLKSLGQVFEKKSKVISDIAPDITEYLESIKLDFTEQIIPKGIILLIILRIQCNMVKKFMTAIELLKKTGNNILEVPDGHLCCGSAGTYNLLR